MNVSVLGASGKVGRLVVAELLSHGHSVHALVHTNNPFTPTAGLVIHTGDVHDEAIVANLLDGSDAVISTLGSWGTKRKDSVSAGTLNVVSCMQKQGVKRILTLTGTDALLPGEKLGLFRAIFHWLLLHSPMAPILRDGEAHLVSLSTSDLLWTCIRSPVMKNTSRTTQNGHLTMKLPSIFATVSRKSVMMTIVNELEQAQFIGKAPFVTESKSAEL